MQLDPLEPWEVAVVLLIGAALMLLTARMLWPLFPR